MGEGFRDIIISMTKDFRILAIRIEVHMQDSRFKVHSSSIRAFER
jgi:hypothetical protein